MDFNKNGGRLDLKKIKGIGERQAEKNHFKFWWREGILKGSSKL